MNNTYELLELEYKKHKCELGDYIDLSDKLLDAKNYIFTIGSIPVGVFVYEFFNKEDITDETIKLLSKYGKYNNNRQHIGGKIDKHKLQKCFHKYINNNTRYDSSGCRIKKSDSCKYEFGNSIKYLVLNKDKEIYKKNIEIYNKVLKSIVNKSNKLLNKFFSLDKKSEIYSHWNELILNHSYRSALHTDINNADDISCLITLAKGNKLHHSNLNLPDYNVSIPMRTNQSILLMNLKHIRHSNDILRDDILSEKISMVFYNK